MADPHTIDARWPDAAPGEHVVYHLCGLIPGRDPVDDDFARIYIGVTSNLRQRLAAHARKWWWAAVVPELCEFSIESTRAAAETLERRLIHCYQPAMNRAGRLLIVTAP